MFNKPNYIDEKYIEATNVGWIDNRSGEILVSVTRMLDRMKAKGVMVEELIINESHIPELNAYEVTSPTKIEETVEEKQDAIADLLGVLDKVKSHKEVEEKSTRPRGRPRKIQEPQEGVVVSKRRGRPKKNV